MSDSFPVCSWKRNRLQLALVNFVRDKRVVAKNLESRKVIEEKLKKQQLPLRLNQSIYQKLKEISSKKHKSVNRLITEAITQNLESHTQDCSIIPEKRNKTEKLIEYRIRFTESEAERLTKYAQENSWSVPKEIQYRVIGTLSNNEKISPKELEAIRGIKVSINALGNNINRIIREDRVMDKTGVEACTLLSNNIDKVRGLIMQIYEKSRERFSLKKIK